MVGAHVALHPRAGQSKVCHGVPWAGVGEAPRTSSDPRAWTESWTCEDGSFALDVPEASAVSLVVTIDGNVAAVRGARELELDRPILVEVPRPPPCRGDCWRSTRGPARAGTCSRRTSRDPRAGPRLGRTAFYRFDRLAPGGWMLRAFEPGRTPGARVLCLDGAASAPDVILAAGQSAKFDLAGAPARADLVGRFGLGGRDLGSWSVAVGGAGVRREHLEWRPLDTRGRFRIAVRPNAEVDLHFASSEHEYRHLELRANAVLQVGRNHWSLDLPLGELTCRAPATLVHEADGSRTVRKVTYGGSPRSGAVVAAELADSGAEEAAVWLLPAGRGCGHHRDFRVPIDPRPRRAHRDRGRRAHSGRRPRRGGAAVSVRVACRIAVVLAALGGGALRAQGLDRLRGEPLFYERPASAGPVERLAARLASGEARLEHDAGAGYLPALLAALEIPVESQVLVFSKTSFQNERISPRTPRAIYFGDAAYVGTIPGSPIVEVTSMDPEHGPVFYTLGQGAERPPRFVRRDDECLQCHATSRTYASGPGNLVRSVHPDRRGAADPALRDRDVVNARRRPFEKRWGGWYVSGTHGDGPPPRQHHRGGGHRDRARRPGARREHRRT